MRHKGVVSYGQPSFRRRWRWRRTRRLGTPLRNRCSKKILVVVIWIFLPTGWTRRREPKQDGIKARRLGQRRRFVPFRKHSTRKCLKSIRYHPPPPNLSVKISGVKLNVSMDASITQESKGVMNSGGLILKYAFGADRSSVAKELVNASGLLLWALEGGQMEPLPRLCLAVDFAEQNIVKASGSHARFRQDVTDSCSEIAARWDDIEPPQDYDGPDWS